jgi:purine-binding chemotaxis protein CheW
MNRPELARRRASSAARHTAEATRQVFTVSLGGETLGLPIEFVRTVLRAETIAPAPLAPPWVLGLLNLRGHVVVAVSLRARLGLPEASPLASPLLAVGVEIANETLAVAVDAVGDVVDIAEDRRIPTPPGMAESVRRLTMAVYATESGFMPVIDLRAAFLETGARAA